MSAAAGTKAGVDAAAGEGERRLWQPLPTFASYVATGGLYGIWWFWVARREMLRELGRQPSGAVVLLEGVGQLVPVVNAYVWHRVITDLNELRARVRAPAVNLWGWVAALALAVPCIFLLPEVLGPLLDLFNSDLRGIVRAVGYALFPAQLLVFGYVMGYYNEYWLEKTGERADRRRLGPFEWIGLLLAAALVVAAIAAFVAEI